MSTYLSPAQVAQIMGVSRDTVYSMINYTLGELIENLDLSEGAALKGTGTSSATDGSAKSCN